MSDDNIALLLSFLLNSISLSYMWKEDYSDGINVIVIGVTPFRAGMDIL